MDIARLNRHAWDRQAADGGRWSRPVSDVVIERARQGGWAIRLTPNADVPPDWIPPPDGLAILCLAGGGGQQAPVLAAAGGNVTVLDNSPGQLDADRDVASRHGLKLQLDLGDMRDLSRYASRKFDLIVHPISNCFVDDVRVVWRECYRVLRPGGRLLAGFLNPAFFIFDETADRDRRALEVRHSLPYSDLDSLGEREVEQRAHAGEGATFSHTLESLIGGQIDAGFLIAGFYEDDWDDEATTLNQYMPTAIATLALRPLTSGNEGREESGPGNSGP